MVRSAARHLLAVGAHLKNAVAAAVGREVFVSQHIGDLETPQAHAAFARVVSDLGRLYELSPSAIACDAHPDYLSTQHAMASGLPTVTVQHHYAHVLSCMADNGLSAPALGVAFDGTGYGDDGSIWGGEFLRVDDLGYRRVAHLRPFRLPGGDRAVKEPRRAAFGVLYELFGEEVFSRDDLSIIRALKEERGVLLPMMEKGLNAPWTTSAGRLFDAVAALCGVRGEVHYEGQAAMELEFALTSPGKDGGYAFALREPETPDAPIIVDWEPVFCAVLDDVKKSVPAGRISARFHDALVEAIIAVAHRIGEPQVALSGGCFQNVYLLERTVRHLESEGFEPYWHHSVPPNDGGIALGQIVAASRQNP
jgi:hydrogenase maturation protein HypF